MSGSQRYNNKLYLINNERDIFDFSIKNRARPSSSLNEGGLEITMTALQICPQIQFYQIYQLIENMIYQAINNNKFFYIFDHVGKIYTLTGSKINNFVPLSRLRKANRRGYSPRTVSSPR